ncbi:MAG: (2Fe-2S)-binding protein [Deltaproteobacteria bacterium]|nr:(2Fe-2S)-binding protein [Deltaproteobacteria bacterium]
MQPKPIEEVTVTINGRKERLAVDPAKRLLDVLREDLGLTGTKEGCGKGECGACTVLIDGRPVNSCLVLVGSVDGHEVLTIEGLAQPDAAMHPVQQAFVEQGAIQCGFCTPGAVLTAVSLVDSQPAADEEAIRRYMAGNLCRCTGYTKIVSAVKTAYEILSERKGAGRRKKEC